MWSGMVWFHTVERKIPLIMSAAPARVSRTSTHTMLGATPAAATAAPHAIAATITARPWWCTCRVQPEVSVASRLPIVPTL